MATLSYVQVTDGATSVEWDFNLEDYPSEVPQGDADALFAWKKQKHQEYGWTIQNLGARSFRATKVGKRTRIRTFRVRG